MSLMSLVRAASLAAIAALATVAATPASAATTVVDLPDELVPFSVVAGPDGRMWFVAADRHLYADFSTSEGADDYFYRGVVGSIGAAGDVRTVAEGRGNDSALNALPRHPVFGGDGNMYGAGGSSGNVVRVTPAGAADTIAAGPNGKAIGTVARADDGTIWFGSTPGEARFVGRIAADGSAQSFTAGLLSSPTHLVAGLGSPLWMVDSAGRLLRVDASGRSRTIRMPRARFTAITRSSDARIWATTGSAAWRIGRRGPAQATCAFGPSTQVRDLVAGSAGGVWGMADPARTDGPPYPVRISRTGAVTGYPDALPADRKVWDLAPGADGSLLVAYRTGPEDLRRQAGHVARITADGGKQLCGPRLRKVPKSDVPR